MYDHAVNTRLLPLDLAEAWTRRSRIRPNLVRLNDLIEEESTHRSTCLADVIQTHLVFAMSFDAQKLHLIDCTVGDDGCTGRTYGDVYVQGTSPLVTRASPRNLLHQRSDAGQINDCVLRWFEEYARRVETLRYLHGRIAMSLFPTSGAGFSSVVSRGALRVTFSAIILPELTTFDLGRPLYIFAYQISFSMLSIEDQRILHDEKQAGTPFKPLRRAQLQSRHWVSVLFYRAVRVHTMLHAFFHRLAPVNSRKVLTESFQVYLVWMSWMCVFC